MRATFVGAKRRRETATWQTIRDKLLRQRAPARYRKFTQSRTPAPAGHQHTHQRENPGFTLEETSNCRAYKSEMALGHRLKRRVRLTCTAGATLLTNPHTHSLTGITNQLTAVHHNRTELVRKGALRTPAHSKGVRVSRNWPSGIARNGGFGLHARQARHF
jgi:hypothetical protein